MNHVLLVSDQPMPHFLPILNSEIKPRSVTLVISKKMQNRANWLKAEIEKHQVEILEDILIGDDVSDIASIQNALMEWMYENEEVSSRSVLNVTGGTKPMAIAAQEVFRMGERPVFYVDVATDRIMWLHTAGNLSKPIQFMNQPTLNQFFRLNGILIKEGDFRSAVENEKWKHFYCEIASDPGKWAHLIQALNAIASEAEAEGSKDFEVPPSILAYSGWCEMSDMLHADELIRYKDGGAREVFCSAAARRFCNGIWLEHYVFNILKSFGFDKNF